jgi:late competence protein required for DNA uptake (superfamily II DNA/RNA helicase)
MGIQLRDYQIECIEEIKKQKPGSYLIQLMTGGGKTVIFSQLENIFRGRILLISHREELVNQPKKYFNSSFGIEQGKNKSTNEKIVSASIQSLVRRLDKFNKNDFEVVITDECHHAAASSYKKVYDYFNFKYHFGFTATPNRADQKSLEDVFDEIIFEKDLKWGIKNGWLTDIDCKRVNIGYDLTGCKKINGDFKEKDLEREVNLSNCNKAIAEAYHKLAKGQALIFAINVKHAQEINKLIPGSVLVTAKTKNRDKIFQDFSNKKIKCIINVLVVSEGTDLPLIETIIIARPTMNTSLYTQMVGRGIRLSQGKDKLLLIDCVGVSNLPICTAPTLVGLKLDNVPGSSQNEIEGNLFDLELKINKNSDVPESWINNIKTVNIWQKETGYNTHDVNYFKMSNGDLVLNLNLKSKVLKFKILKPDELGYTMFQGEKQKLQKILDRIFTYLNKNHINERPLWNVSSLKRWGNVPASKKQLELINKLKGNYKVPSRIKKGEASIVLNRLLIERSGWFKGGKHGQ